MSELYRDFIDQKADQIINSLGGAITPPPANAELYRDFLDRKFDDVINAIGNIPTSGGIKVDYSTTLFDQTSTSWADTLTYTAIQDCIVYIIGKSNGDYNPYVIVNGNNVVYCATDTHSHENVIFLKSGDTIAKRIVTDTSAVYYRFIVYQLT